MSFGQKFLGRLAGVVMSRRTASLLRFDLLRLRARTIQRRNSGQAPRFRRLHFGCGATHIPNWLNVDVIGGDQDVDLGGGRLPWPDDSFDVAMSQHVIEHFELQSELMPLLVELKRVLVPGGEIWLSCPDIEKICRSYVEDRMQSLITDRVDRSGAMWTRPWSLDGEVGLKGVPSSHMINSLFHQGSEHRNLFDFELLSWALTTSGFSGVSRVSEGVLRERFPEVPVRGDDAQSLYVMATA